MNRSLSTLAILSVLLLGACDSLNEPKGGVRMRVELVRLRGGGPATVANLVPSLSLVADGGAVAGDGEWHGITSNIEIESLEVPIREIVLFDTETEEGAHVYECTRGGDGCLVNLASEDFERNLLESSVVRVRVGTYNAIRIGYCSGDNQTNTTYIKATAVLDGKTYYTKSDGSMSLVGPAERAAIEHDCGASLSYLPYPITVTAEAAVQELPDDGGDGEEVIEETGEARLRLYFTTDKFAWALSPMMFLPWYPPCFANLETVDVDDLWICAGYPEVVGFLGTEIPEMERYSLDVHAELTFFLHEGSVMGGLIRMDYNPPFGEAAFPTPATIYKVSKNPDGSLELFGSPTDEGYWTFHFPAFQRSTHSGKFYDHGPIEFQYTATQLP